MERVELEHLLRLLDQGQSLTDVFVTGKKKALLYLTYPL